MFTINKKHIKKNTTPYYLSYPYEEWKLITELDNYYISNFGRVYSIEKDKIISTFVQNTGYVCVSLYKNGKKLNYTIHRLVARYFIPNPNNYTDIDHIDNNKFNNHISNLQWCTHIYNTAKRDNRCIVLYDENKNKLGLYNSAPSLSEDINITKNVINHKLRRVKNGELIDVFDKINNIKYYIKKL